MSWSCCYCIQGSLLESCNNNSLWGLYVRRSLKFRTILVKGENIMECSATQNCHYRFVLYLSFTQTTRDDPSLPSNNIPSQRRCCCCCCCNEKFCDRVDVKFMSTFLTIFNNNFKMIECLGMYSLNDVIITPHLLHISHKYSHRISNEYKYGENKNVSLFLLLYCWGKDNRYIIYMKYIITPEATMNAWRLEKQSFLCSPKLFIFPFFGLRIIFHAYIYLTL